MTIKQWHGNGMAVLANQMKVGGLVTDPETIPLAGGFAEWDKDPASWVRVGDRDLPARIEVTFVSSPDRWPSLSMVIEVRNGAPQCVSLSMDAHAEGREIRGVDLRAVRLEQWIDEIAALAAMRGPSGGVVDMSLTEFARALEAGSDEREFRKAQNTVRSARTRARRKMNDELLGQVAETYRQNLAGQPVEAVQRAFGTSYRSAARYVEMARRAGLLPATTPGKAKG